MWCEIEREYSATSDAATSAQGMGPYRIQLKDGAIAEIHTTMKLIGRPIIRVEERSKSTYYFYEHSKHKSQIAFWIVSRDEKFFWYSGVSAETRAIAECFAAAGLFEDDERNG